MMTDIQKAASTISNALPKGFEFTGYCSDYLGCWVFPFIRIPFDFGANGYLFVNKESLKVRMAHPGFDLEDYLQAPVVMEPEEFAKCQRIKNVAAKRKNGTKWLQELLGSE